MKARILQVLPLLLSVIALAVSLRGHAPAAAPVLMGAGGPGSWNVTAWFVDPGNHSGCASDANTGQSATCSSGGVGPLQHKSVITSRWGTASPTLTVGVTITYLSADTDKTDPGFFAPKTVNGGSFTQMAILPTSTFTGTLNVVTAKNFTTNQALNATFTTSTGAVAVDMLLHNTTHESWAIAHRIVSGSTWQISEPMLSYPGGGAFPTPTEVNTWAHSDVITGYVPIAVNIVRMGGVGADINQSTFGPNFVVTQLTVFDPPGDFDPVYLNTGANIAVDRVVFGRALAINGQSSPSIFQTIMNSATTEQTQCNAPDVQFSGGILDNGGTFALGDAFANNIILAAGSGGFAFYDTDLDDCELFLDTATVFNARGTTFVAGGSIIAHIYGQGTYNQGAGTTYFHETAAAHFFAQINIGGQSTACALDSSGDPAIAHCGRTLNGANIDQTVTSGGFGSNAFETGIGGIVFGNP